MTSEDNVYELRCPACKTTKYRNPQMRLMVNVCGHALCNSCVTLLFIKESGQCPECDMVLKRSKFRTQIFEDPVVEKEIDIRRRVMRIYFKHEEDFEDVEDYNMYLEEIEETVYNLTNDINKAELEKKLEFMERRYKDDIKKYCYKKSRAEEELIQLIDTEKLRTLQRKKVDIDEQKKSAISKVKQQSMLLEDLMASDGDASLIVKSHAEKLRIEQEEENENKLLQRAEEMQTQSHQFSTGIKFGFGGTTAGGSYSVAKQVVYAYEEPVLPHSLPTPKWDELEPQGYLQFVRKSLPPAVAGGYTEHYACLKALQEFMWGHTLPLA